MSGDSASAADDASTGEDSSSHASAEREHQSVGAALRRAPFHLACQGGPRVVVSGNGAARGQSIGYETRKRVAFQEYGRAWIGDNARRLRVDDSFRSESGS